MEIYTDLELCKTCGGKCCRLFEETTEVSRRKLQNFDGAYFSTRFGVTPKYNMRKAWTIGSAADQIAYRAKLRQEGIDPEMCAFHDKESGCPFSVDTRPLGCKLYICEEAKATL